MELVLPHWHNPPVRLAASSLFPALSPAFFTLNSKPCFLNIAQGILVVPQQSAWVVERFGKFHTILSPGLHLLVPVMDRIAYVHSLKEMAVAIPNQTAITKDNVTIQIDGVLYVKVMDPEAASYGVSGTVIDVMCVIATLRVLCQFVPSVSVYGLTGGGSAVRGHTARANYDAVRAWQNHPRQNL